MRNDRPAYVRHIYAHELRCKKRTLSLFALLSLAFASYVISVRRTSALPSASFRFHLAMDTLAVRLAVPLAGPALDFHQLVIAPCRAHHQKGRIRPGSSHVSQALAPITRSAACRSY